MKLKEFQQEGREFLAARRRAILGDEMRLGKSPQAIFAAYDVAAKRILVICPAIARTHWKEMFKLWWPDRGDPSTWPLIRIVSYDTARLYPERFTSRRWDVLILDEFHFLKNIDAKRTSTVLGKCGIAWHAFRIWALSGTPAPNHAGELWPILRAFGAVKATLTDFIYHFCEVIPETGKVVGTKRRNIPELRELLKPVFLRRRKKDVAPELPAASVTPHYIKGSPTNLDLIRPVNTHLWVQQIQTEEQALKRAIEHMSPEDMLNYLDSHYDQYSTLRRLTAVLKTPELIDTLRFELDTGLLDKCVVFGYHVDALKLSARLLRDQGYRTDMLYGGTPRGKVDTILNRFKRPANKKGTQVLFAQIIAAGTAIDLSAAHQGILLERDWVPGNNAQALERMGGYNQTQPITIRDFIIPGSADDVVSAVASRKMSELSELFD